MSGTKQNVKSHFPLLFNREESNRQLSMNDNVKGTKDKKNKNKGKKPTVLKVGGNRNKGMSSSEMRNKGFLR